MARVKGHPRTKKRYQGIKSRHQVPTGEQQYLCQCPRCLTFETLWLIGDFLVPTIKFSQGGDGRVYHDCNRGSVEPCRLFPEWRVRPGHK